MPEPVEHIAQLDVGRLVRHVARVVVDEERVVGVELPLLRFERNHHAEDRDQPHNQDKSLHRSLHLASC